MSELGRSPGEDQNNEKKSYRDQLLDAMQAAEQWQTDKVDSEENKVIRERKLEGFKNFLRFEILPEDDPDFFIVAGTSPIIDPDRYRSRVEKAIEFAKKYPSSKLIFSGQMPIDERVTGKESTSEAEMMAQAALEGGVIDDQIIIETQSRHLKENIEFSLRKILDQIEPSEKPLGVAIVASMSMMRRCYYYATKILESEEFVGSKDKIKLYCIPSDDNLNDEGAIYYEIRRLLEYREQGWL